MIRKSGHRFSLATNAKRLRGDHAQTKSSSARQHKSRPLTFPIKPVAVLGAP
jgi:hypothetical protein